VYLVVVEAKGTVTKSSEDTVRRIYSAPTHILSVEKPHISHDLTFAFALKRKTTNHHEIFTVKADHRVRCTSTWLDVVGESYFIEL
jgi:hypothetical protein